MATVALDYNRGALEVRNILTEASQEVAEPFEKNRKNILIVDDDETILHLLKRFFTREGFQVFVAKDGLEAIEKLKVKKPDIVLTDLKMPSLPGIELIRFIRKNLINTAIVVMTAYPEDWSRREAEACFAKPFDVEEMFSAIQRIIRTRD